MVIFQGFPRKDKNGRKHMGFPALRLERSSSHVPLILIHGIFKVTQLDATPKNQDLGPRAYTRWNLFTAKPSLEKIGWLGRRVRLSST